MRAALTLSALLLGGCSEPSGKPNVTPAAEARPGLRVPMPDGWAARANGAGLEVGPQGRVVLHLESTAREFPAPELFFTAIEGETVDITQKESIDDFLGARYSVKGDDRVVRDAFLGVRKTGERTVWCSTSANARRDEVDAAMTVCRSLSWEG